MLLVNDISAPFIFDSFTYSSPIIDGLKKLAAQEGFRGLSKGMVLALFGVSNGAIQFMTYEELKKWRMESRRERLGGRITEAEAKKLVSSSARC